MRSNTPKIKRTRPSSKLRCRFRRIVWIPAAPCRSPPPDGMPPGSPLAAAEQDVTEWIAVLNSLPGQRRAMAPTHIRYEVASTITVPPGGQLLGSRLRREGEAPEEFQELDISTVDDPKLFCRIPSVHPYVPRSDWLYLAMPTA